MAPLRYAAKFDPFLSLDCASTPSTLAQSKERMGSNFAIWQPCIKIFSFQGFTYAAGKDEADGLDRAHSELVIRELAKFHAITFCLKMGDNDCMIER